MRDTVSIMFGGAVYQLRPTWQAYAEIESRTGKSLRALWISIASGDVKLMELATVVMAGMKAADPNMNLSESATMRALFDAGVWWDQDEGIALKVAEYLEMLGWTPEQREKIKAEIEKQQG